MSSLKKNGFHKPDYNYLYKKTYHHHVLGQYYSFLLTSYREGGRRGNVSHASWGALLALEYKLYEDALAIGGHYKAFPDKADLNDDVDALMN